MRAVSQPAEHSDGRCGSAGLAEDLAVQDDDRVGAEDHAPGQRSRDRARLGERDRRGGVGGRAGRQPLIDPARHHGEVPADPREELTAPGRCRRQNDARAYSLSARLELA